MNGENRGQVPPAAAMGTMDEVTGRYNVNNDNVASGIPCRAPCLNNASCVNGKCVCRPGYQGEFCAERK